MAGRPAPGRDRVEGAVGVNVCRSETRHELMQGVQIVEVALASPPLADGGLVLANN